MSSKRYCWKCGWEVTDLEFVSDDYEYYCPNCDEDLYSFETYEIEDELAAAVVSLEGYRKKRINEQIQELEELVIQITPDLDEQTRDEVRALMQYVKEQWWTED